MGQRPSKDGHCTSAIYPRLRSPRFCFKLVLLYVFDESVCKSIEIVFVPRLAPVVLDVETALVVVLAITCVDHFLAETSRIR